jgi:hypothetical protein
VRKKTFERSSLYVDGAIPAMLAITGIRDWPHFQEYQDMVNQRLNEAALKDRDRRNAGERVAQNGLIWYDVGSTSRLAELVGFNNVGVKYRCDWTSKAATEAWVTNEKEKAAKSKMRNVSNLLPNGVFKKLTWITILVHQTI